MDDVYYEKILYRILQGRLRLRLGDLVLFVEEPTADIIEESFEIYDKAYKEAYYNKVPIKEELLDILIDNNMWSPLDDKTAEKIEKEIEEMKLQAFEKFYDTRFLNSIKMNLRKKEEDLYKTKKKKLALDHTSCEGVASFSRSLWVLNHTTFYAKNHKAYDWQHLTVHNLFDLYMSKQIKYESIRYISRKDPWRSMWSLGKKSCGIFNRDLMDTTKDQHTLCHYSIMYDNIYEHPNSPNDKVINDDDCLDGWMIKQRRETEKNKKQQEVDALTKNSKIANSQEVFLMARDQESANEIYNLNNPHAKNLVKQREQQIKNSEGSLNFKELIDIKQDIAVQSHQQALQGAKTKGRGRR
jgi:hypothetical protein